MTALAPRPRRFALASAVVTLTAALIASAAAAQPQSPVTAAEASPTVTLSSCASSDNGFPDLAGITVEPRTLDVRKHDGWLTVGAMPVDDGGPGPATGITEVGVEMAGLGSPTMKPQPDGTWMGRLRVPRGVKPGEYIVGSVRLRDGSRSPLRNVRDFFFDRAAAERMGASTQIASERDRRAPKLRWLRASTTSVDVTTRAAHIRVRARVTDDASGARTASLMTDAGATAHLRIRHGTRHDGIWAGTLTVTRWTPRRSATYNLLFSATDRPGNQRLIFTDVLAKRDMPSTLTVTTRRADRDAPQLTKVELAPNTIDLTDGDRPVTLTVHARDDLSGVGATVFVVTPMRRISGDRNRGVWRQTEVLDQCFWPPRDARLELVFFDRANNRVATRKPISIINRNDIRPPYPTLFGPAQRGATEPVTYQFNEDVTGISSTAAPIRPTGPGMGFGVDDPPPAVPGSWSCAASSGAPVDCVAGPLRTATWTPSAPLTPGQDYGVDLNPEHVLDVIDLAGNPIDARLRYEDEYAPTWRVTG